MVVEMVEKLMVEVDFLVEKEEEEEGGVVVVIGMEEMEERMVVEMAVEKVERMTGQGGTKAAVVLSLACWK